MPYKRKWKLPRPKLKNPMPQPTDRRQTLIDAINRIPGVQAFAQNNLIRIRCLGCGNRIIFDNGTAIRSTDNQIVLAYARNCISEHHCSKQIPPTIETTNNGINWNPPAGAYDPFSGDPSGSYSLTSSGRIRKPLSQTNKPPDPPKPKFSRRFDLDSES